MELKVPFAGRVSTTGPDGDEPGPATTSRGTPGTAAAAEAMELPAIDGKLLEPGPTGTVADR